MESTNRAQRTADLALGAAIFAAPHVGRAAKIATTPAVLAWHVVRRPPLLPERFAPASIAGRWEARGRLARQTHVDLGIDATGRLFDALVPAIATVVIDRLDLPELIVQVVTPETVDAVIARVDVPDVVTKILSPATVDAALAQLDPVALTEQYLDPVAVEKFVAIALPPVMAAVLDQLDVTEVVRENVDLVGLTNEVVARIDLAGITNEVIDEIDLPGIIRESTSGVATEVMRGTRASAASADEAIASFFGRRRRD